MAIVFFVLFCGQNVAPVRIGLKEKRRDSSFQTVAVSANNGGSF
jgi:hypothetical protein